MHQSSWYIQRKKKKRKLQIQILESCIVILSRKREKNIAASLANNASLDSITKSRQKKH